jgi:alanine dehydrogenase
MIIGIPKEIKAQENRIAATPAGVASFVKAGHKVIVQKDGGIGSGFSNEEYISTGAEIVDSAKEVYDRSNLIYKVKEPLEPEYDLLRENHIIFTYLHLAPDLQQTEALLKSKCTAIAYETVQLDNGSLPLLAPMSEIAGKMAVQVGAGLLQKINGGSGVLLGGIPGVAPGRVVILGGGIAGTAATRVAYGMGAIVTVLDLSSERMTYLQDIFPGVITIMSTPHAIATAVRDADLLIGAVLVAGDKAPKLVTEEMVKTMNTGSVIVDISIDQGGTVETIDKTTSHKEPFYEKHSVLHYSVPNIPGAVPRTSTYALSNATLPYALEIANKGVIEAMKENPALFKGLSVYKGNIACKAVAEAQGRKYVPVLL